MNADPRISQWLNDAKTGDADAVAQLWEHYIPQLVRLARQKLAGAPRQMADEEDVAISAFQSFCRAAEQGRFPELRERDGLWRLLFQMTARKAVDHWRWETSEKHGGGKVQNEANLEDSRHAAVSLDQMAAHSNTPEFVALMAEGCEERLKSLTPQLRQLALAKLEGDTNREAAERLHCTERSVEYGLNVIRKKWAFLESSEKGGPPKIEKIDGGNGV